MDKLAGHAEASGTTAPVAAAPAPAPGIASLPLWASAALATFALAVMWLVGFDNGQLSSVVDGTGSYLHELFHDGRHLFGAPCH